MAWLVVWLLQRLLNPVIRVAIGERMKQEPADEVAARIDTLTHVIYRTALMFVLLLAGIMVLTEAGLNVAPLIAGVGLVGLAVGFGAQSLVKDVINGLFILIDNQYSKGDVVTLGGISGIVEDINLRRTVLRDLDGVVHFIPHSSIAVASNWTMEYSRINLDVGVAYESNLDHVIEVINRVGNELAVDPEHARKFRSPPQVLRVDKFGDSQIDIKIVGDTVPLEQWALTGELRLRLKRAFDAEGIVIPYPQRTLHLETAQALIARGQESRIAWSGEPAATDMESEARALDDSPESD